MRILICIGRYFPNNGPERYLFRVARLLEEAGHTVIPLAVDYPQTVDTPYRKYFVRPVSPGAKLQYADFKDDYSFLDGLRMAARAVYSREAKWQAKRAIIQESIDLVYALHITNTLSPSIIHAARTCGIPVVMRVSDYNMMCPMYSFFRDGRICRDCTTKSVLAGVLHRCVQGSVRASAARAVAVWCHRFMRVYGSVQRFVCPTTVMCTELARSGIPPSRIRLLRTFADDQDPVYLSRERRHFLYVGRIVPPKGIPVLLKAASRLRSSVPLIIAGVGPQALTQLYVEQAAQLGLSDIRFVGYKTGHELEDLVRSSFATIVPSIWPENGPNSAIESLALGTPVIASRIAGVSEYVDGCTGAMFEPGSDQQLGTVMQQFLDDPELVEEKARAAHARAATELAPSRHLAELLRIFEEAKTLAARR